MHVIFMLIFDDCFYSNTSLKGTILPPSYFRVFVIKEMQEPLLANSMLYPGYY